MPDGLQLPSFIPFSQLYEAGLKPIEWHWRGWVPKGTFQTWIGKSGIGKSWSALDLAIATIYGVNMLGQPVQKGSVLYVSAENAWAEDGRRARLILAGRGIKNHKPMDESFKFVDAVGLGLLARDGDKRLQGLVEQANPSLVVLDSASALAMLEDENSNSEVGRLVDKRILPWQRSIGCTVIMTHNAGKGQDKEWVARGASAWKDKADGSIAFWPSKDEDALEMWQCKVRVGRPHPAILIREVFEGGDSDDPSVLDTSMRHELVGAQKDTLEPSLQAVVDALRKLGEADVVTVANEVGLDHQAARRKLNALVEPLKRVECREEGRGGKMLYKLAC